MLRFFTIIIACYILPCNAIVHQISKIEDVTQYAKHNTVYFFDLDNTLIAPQTNLGTEVWFGEVWRLYKEAEVAEDYRQALRMWENVQKQVTYLPVEDATVSVMDGLCSAKNCEHLVFGLTSRNPGLYSFTKAHLEHSGIAFNTLFQKDFVLPEQRFQDGVFFTAGMDKGTSLKTLFARWDFVPEHIIFVDDSERHVLNVERACAEMGIPVDTFRYGALDAKVMAYKEELSILSQFYKPDNLAANLWLLEAVSK